MIIDGLFDSNLTLLWLNCNLTLANERSGQLRVLQPNFCRDAWENTESFQTLDWRSINLYMSLHHKSLVALQVSSGYQIKLSPLSPMILICRFQLVLLRVMEVNWIYTLLVCWIPRYCGTIVIRQIFLVLIILHFRVFKMVTRF